MKLEGYEMDQTLKEKLVKSYDAEAHRRNEDVTPEWKDAERETFLGWMIEEKTSSVLDLGAGPGKDSLFFQENGIHPFAVDISPEMISLCREKEVQAEVLSCDEVNKLGRKFDAVWAMNSLLHIQKKDIETVLREIHDLLNERGLFYLGLYGGDNKEGVWEDDHYEPKRFFSFHSSTAIQQLVATYFTIENVVVLPPHTVGSQLEFQSLILRKKGSIGKNNISGQAK
ncbi:class I SAM-dependent methyltransferase [Rossellomorea aquimaris]|uniref:Class I SAM-dependent methyltransferase n=2 Tax=Bacillaceae TaxID=186817 RepID=A0A5D4U6J7_9BACI|nr:class I SAM-dependent methyltransferase [Rossellomorea aquimaris]